MCWNSAVSLNTFAFSAFVLALVIYNNTYTKYKIAGLNSIGSYLFIASFIFMQLIEYFIWINLNNRSYNTALSASAIILLMLQPLASIMIITNKHLRNKLAICYIALALPYTLYNMHIKRSYSQVSKKGHLDWEFFNASPIAIAVWFFFFLFSFVYEKKYMLLLFGLSLLAISFTNYLTDKSMWSMWCWSVNSIMLYYAFILLFYLPFITL